MKPYCVQYLHITDQQQYDRSNQLNTKNVARKQLADDDMILILILYWKPFSSSSKQNNSMKRGKQLAID